MRKELIKQMQEQIGVARSAQCRVQMLFRSDLKDPGYEILQRMSQAISDMEQLLLNAEQKDSDSNLTAREDVRFFLKQLPHGASDAEIGKYFKELPE